MILYYLKKILRIANVHWVLFFSQYPLKKSPGLIKVSFFESLQLPENRYTRVLFDFSDSGVIHLGDQLFHLPLMQLLTTNGIDVAIVGPTQLDDLYHRLGMRIIHQTDDLSDALIVSKKEMFPRLVSLKPKGSLFLGFEYMALGGDQRISDVLISKVMPHLNLVHQSFSFNPTWVTQVFSASSETFSDEPICLINHMVSSHRLQAKSRVFEFVDLAKQMKAKGYKLILLGSHSDQNVKVPYHEFVDLDLRGQISMTELFELFKSSQVKVVISFDTFLAHLASLFSKDLILVHKSPARSAMVNQRFIPFWNTQDPIQSI